MREKGCRFDIRFGGKSECEFRLKLDKDDAHYRKSRGVAEMSPMCDFVAGAQLLGDTRLTVVELKSGVADSGAFDQLQRGLDLVEKNLPQSLVPTLVDAYLVVGRELGRLMNLQRSEPRYMRFGSRRFLPTLTKCGATVGD